MNYQDGITINPRRMGGVPCIRNLRIPVETILYLIHQGATRENIIAAYPDLVSQDIDNVLEYERYNSQESQSKDFPCPV